jgi:methionyl-tRNA formyltransferase
MGSPDFAVPALERLSLVSQVVAVITQPDRPSGRGRILQPPPVKLKALELKIPVLQPFKINDPLVLKQLMEYEPNIILVAAYGQILRKTILELTPFGCVNIHASLLPRWRGAAPIQACILAGDENTGVTIMKMDAGVDTGPILAQASIRIESDDTGGSLFNKLADLGGSLLMDTLPGYLVGEIQPEPQEDLQATYAPMLKREDGLLDPGQPADILARKVRAFNPWPGTFIQSNGNILKVHAAHQEHGGGEIGHRIELNGFPAISTIKGNLVLDVVQPSGKKTMSGKAFLSGARNWFET